MGQTISEPVVEKVRKISPAWYTSCLLNIQSIHQATYTPCLLETCRHPVHGNFLSSMPNEIIEAIFGYLHVDDIDAFALTSKCIRAAAGRPFCKHQELKKGYSHIVFDWFGSTADGSAIRMLDLILQNPDLRFYPRSIDVRQLEQSCIGLTSKAYAITSQEREILERNDYFRSLWDVWPRLHQRNKRRLEENVRMFNDDPNMHTLLLTVLPNLRTLKTRAWNKSVGYCTRLVAVDADPVDRNTYMTGAPNKLEEIIFYQTYSRSRQMFSSGSRVTGEDLYCYYLHSIEDLLEWGSLPSIRRLCGDLVEGRPGCNERWDTYQLKNVEEISLTNSFIDTEKILWILAKSAVLKIFKYEFHQYYWSSPTAFEPHLICQGLATHASRTLEHLVLTPGRDSGHRGNYKSPIDSLRNFQVLKTIEFDSGFLNTPRGTFPKVTLRLVDVLPASIEVVCFRVWQRKTVRDSLAGIEELGSSQMPNLRDLVLHVDRYPAGEPIKQICQNCGVNLVEERDDQNRNRVPACLRK